jgi:hypothetical protein
MKGKVVTLIAGAALGTAGTGLALTTLGRYGVPRGYVATFVGVPKLACMNKSLASNAGAVPPGSVGVLCFTNLSKDAKPNYWVVFQPDRLSVYSPTDRLAFRARTG